MASPAKAATHKGKSAKKAIKQKPKARHHVGPSVSASSLHDQSTSTAGVDALQDRGADVPSPSPANVFSLPKFSELEKAVGTIKATLPSATNREELRKDPIYRIMHTLPRSDVLEVVRSRFATAHCTRAAAYFDLSYMRNPLRHLRLQIGCDGPTGMHLFLPRISFHRHTLRMVDLSRNRLGEEEVVLLCNALGLGQSGNVCASLVTEQRGPLLVSCAASSSQLSPSPVSSLEVLDLSYNSKIGNGGALHVLRALRRCASIRAVMLKSVGVDDSGAFAIADVVHHWPQPVPPVAGEGGVVVPAHFLRPATASATKFYLNLNENYIGAPGTCVLGKGLPPFVSLTLATQRLAPVKDRKRDRSERVDGAGN